MSNLVFMLWGRLYKYAIFFPHERLLKPMAHSLHFVCTWPDQGCGLCPDGLAVDHVNISLEPIGTGLLRNKKLIID